MGPEEWNKGNIININIYFGKEREAFLMCTGESHLMPNGTHSHCARVEYMAMLMAMLTVFNWRMAPSSGKVDW